jgi:spoIIIJ-associated protein
MQSIELTAKTVEEAKAVAADKFSVSPDQIEVTVLETVKGLFGKSQLRVRATVIDTAVPNAKPEPKAKAAKPKPEPKTSEPKAEAVAEPESEPKKEAASKGISGSKSEPEPVAESGEEPVVEASQEDADALLAHLRKLLDAANFEVEAKVKKIEGRYVSLEIDGRDLGHLVGKHGEVINNLQYLMNISAGRKLGNGVRCILDGDDYRARREEKLTALATKIANQVRARGEEAVLDALPAFERRIVHKALAGMDGVTTYSEGEEPNRRVVIAPVD